MKGVVVAGAGSGVGKTAIATGLMARLSRGYKVQAFKAGPDFIDTKYHAAATGRPSRNLDSFLMDGDVIRNLVGWASKDADLCIVEGVRGLYEGMHGDGDIGSTAHLAKLLGFPVVLVLDARSLTRSAAAIVNGFRSFDPEVDIAGVILNKVSGRQHAAKLETAMERYTDVRVVGMVPRDDGRAPRQRRIGLEAPELPGRAAVGPLAELAEAVDTDAFMEVAERCGAVLPDASPYVRRDCGLTAAVPVDGAYCFHYRENLECLGASGIRVRTYSPVAGDPLPDADIHYLGGGFPEAHAAELAANRDFLEGLAAAAADGAPVLGECGGMLTMCSYLEAGGTRHRMAGILDAAASADGGRSGPSYIRAEALPGNPLSAGEVRGHIYHYYKVDRPDGARFGYRVLRGTGAFGGYDGLCAGNAVGTWMYRHALSEDDWAAGLAGRVR